MLGRIVRHEWRALTSDGALLVLAAVFGVSIGYGVWNGARSVALQRQALADGQREEQQRHAEFQAEIVRIDASGAQVSPFADPRLPANAGRRTASRYAAMPPAPLAAFSVGQSDLLPSYFKMTTDARETLLAATELENPTRLLLGRFDLAFVVIYLYPLLILALSYNLLSAEKEQGTLALLLSQPLPLGTLVLGKVALRAVVFLALVGGSALFLAPLAGLRLASPGALARFAAWALILACYGAFWFALAVAVAAQGRSSATNAALLAGAWLVLVVLVPSTFNLLATTLYPVPSRVEMVQAVRTASDEANAQGAKLLGKFYEDHPELAAGSPEQAQNDFNAIRIAVADDVERRTRPVLERYDRQLASQQRVVDGLRFLSPAILAQDALDDVAGTGTARHRDFVRQVEAYHAEWREYFVPKVLQKVRLTSYEDVPRFRYRDEPLASVLARVLVGAAGLLAPALVIGWVGLLALRRYPVAG
jgi:ABC-2 type transport system permease protein